MKTQKLLLIFLLILLFSTSVASQQVVATAGAYYENDNISLSWTLGETVIATFESDDIILTQGFQQPYNFYLSQILTIPAGWSGISSYIDPLNKGVEDMFSAHIPDFIILASMTEFYYPNGGVNTINNWSWETGYQVKAFNEFELTLTGSKIEPPEVEMGMGWNLIPVLTPCGAGTDEIFSAMTALNIVKDVAGTKVYWPAFGIATLTNLEPGKAYWVSMDDVEGFTYPECTKNNYFANPQDKPQNYTPWNDFNATASSHTIAFPIEVLMDVGIQSGDFIGVFTQDALCAGWAEVNDLSTNLALVAFANDETTIEKDGFEAGELLQFKAYHRQTDEEANMTVNYMPALPQQGIFALQGLSAAKSIILEAFGTNKFPGLLSEVYPNPTNGIFTLGMNYWPEELLIEIKNSRGEIIKTLEAGNKLNSTKLTFDLSGVPPGIYFCILKTNQGIQIKKIIKL